MYQTLTHGFGMMTPQTWMVPQQKYDVIHYIREAYLKPHNPGQYVKIEDAYLAGLPKGASRGPKPSNIEPWVSMNYGPSLMATLEVGDKGNFAYKGIAVRLDNGPGGVSRGRHWMLFDHDTLRVAAAWSGEGFIDWNGINFNGRIKFIRASIGIGALRQPGRPRLGQSRDGPFRRSALEGPRWQALRPAAAIVGAVPGNVSLRQSGHPLVHASARREILEMPAYELTPGEKVVYTRTLNVGKSPRDLLMRVAPDGNGRRPGRRAGDAGREGRLHAAAHPGRGDAAGRQAAAVRRRP